VLVGCVGAREGGGGHTFTHLTHPPPCCTCRVSVTLCFTAAGQLLAQLADSGGGGALVSVQGGPRSAQHAAHQQFRRLASYWQLHLGRAPHVGGAAGG
jgi:hypothetical protein